MEHLDELLNASKCSTLKRTISRWMKMRAMSMLLKLFELCSDTPKVQSLKRRLWTTYRSKVGVIVVLSIRKNGSLINRGVPRLMLSLTICVSSSNHLAKVCMTLSKTTITKDLILVKCGRLRGSLC